jgi:cullin 3
MSRFQGLTKDENVDFEALWRVLETALIEIHTKNASRLSFEELYRNAYKIVLKKKGDVLYEKVSQLEEKWLRGNVRIRINQLVTPSIILGAAGESFAGQSTERRITGERFMRQLKDAYSDHHLCMSMITDVLMYMVRIALSPNVRCQCYVEGSARCSPRPISLKDVLWCHDGQRDFSNPGSLSAICTHLADCVRSGPIVKTNTGLRFI